MAGNMSVPRSMRRIATVEKSRGMTRTTLVRKGRISGMLSVMSAFMRAMESLTPSPVTASKLSVL